MDSVATRLRGCDAGMRFYVWGPGAKRRRPGRYDDVHERASDQELIRPHDSCDVLLHTSRHDGFMLPIEAMARRAAVVASSTGGLVEYAVRGENYLLAAAGDVKALAAAVERLAPDYALWERLVRRGVETAAHCSRERFQASAAQTHDRLAA